MTPSDFAHVKQMKKKTAGPSWFDLPAPAESDLPRLHREVEALRLRNQLDPKRFYRKDEGEGKGIKGLPKYFAVSAFSLKNESYWPLTMITDWHRPSIDHAVWDCKQWQSRPRK
jgi:hypothetical protein